MAHNSVPIAVIGVSCRFPGNINNPEKLWDALNTGRSTWSEVPHDRYEWKSFYHPTRGSNSAHTHRGGHFLTQDVAAFDANFFGISALEAEAIDPQARIQLEVAYEALENAGLSLEAVKGSDTGVYIATFTHDYENMMYADPIRLPKYGMTGVGQAIVSNRISYIFDLKGPSMSLDTGCSGSLVALHQACLSLRSGESSMSLVGGTNLILSPDTMIPMDLLHLLNGDGRCYSFDDRGAGYGRGEGAAMVVLKRLDDALEAGDNIRAVIRNTAVGQDGKTSGITLPNGEAQRSLIRSAYSKAAEDPLKVGYVEAHGTGTVKGDTTEIDALGRAFCEHRVPESPLYVGSIKANIGHLESTSGLAGLIKVVLMLEKGIIPGTPGIETLKTTLDLARWNINIPRSSQPWLRNVPRRASLNSFGYGGANAHAIIETAPLQAPSPRLMRNDTTPKHLLQQSLNGHGQNGSTVLNSGLTGVEITPRAEIYRIFALTARSEKTLRKSVEDLHTWISDQRDSADYLPGLAFTLSRRTLMPWRCTFVATSNEDLETLLDSTTWKPRKMANRVPVSFVFTGQGAQWFGMARELLTTASVFRHSLQDSDEILRSLGASWSLLEELECPAKLSRIDESEIGQPATTAIQIGIVQLFRYLNIIPDGVLGHSSGEIAAAYTVGAISHRGALKLSYHRSFLARRSKQVLNVNGAMLATSLGEEDVLPYLKRIQAGRAVVACCNSPFSTTISGDESAIVELKDTLQRFGISSRRLIVDTAYHSHHMQAVSEEYLQNIQDLEHNIPETTVKFYSSVTGERKLQDFGPAYWVSNLTSKVSFSEALQSMCKDLQDECDQSSTSFVSNIMEIGPSSTLSGPIKQVFTYMRLDATRFNYISALKRYHNSIKTVAEAGAALFERGHVVDLDKVNTLGYNPKSRSLITTLPPYPWDHSTSYWHESWISKAHRLRRHPYHDLLGVRVPSSFGNEPIWRHILSVETLPWLRDHGVDGRLVFPGAGYVAMAIEAVRQVVLDRDLHENIRKYALKDLVFDTFLEIPDSAEKVDVQLSLHCPLGEDVNNINGWKEFRVSSLSNVGASIHHCHGLIKTEFEVVHDELWVSRQREEEFLVESKARDLQVLRNKLVEELDPEGLYANLRANGNHWGPSFAVINAIKVGDLEAAGNVTIPDISQYMPGGFFQSHVVHPSTLDALLHTSLIIFGRACSRGVMFPFRIAELTVSANISKTPGQKLSFVTTIAPHTNSSTSLDVSALQEDPAGGSEVCIEIKNGELRGAPLPQTTLDTNIVKCYELEWGIDTDLCQPEGKVSQHGSESKISPTSKMEMLNQAAQDLIRETLLKIPEGSVKNDHLDYFRWMKQMVSHATYDDSSKQAWKVEELSNLGVEGEAILRLGSSLSAILSGKTDPLHLLLQDSLLQRLYAEDTSALECYAHLISYVKSLVFKRPDMEVLEVGAGTGGATLPLLQALAETDTRSLQKYDFTDVSAGFFEDAQKKLEGLRHLLHYATLDISKDPVQQGFEESSYDLIIACNSMHVTRSVDEALAHTRKLLKPGGKLLLVEITTLAPYVNMIFGLLPGWYMNRSDGRIGAPMLSVDQWDQYLRRNSFTGVDFSAKDHDSPAQMVSFLATSSVAAEKTTSPLPGIVLECRAKTTELASFTEGFQKRGFKVVMETLPAHEMKHDEVLVLVDDAESLQALASNSDHLETLTGNFSSANRVLWIRTSLESENSLSKFMEELVARICHTARVKNNQLRLITLVIDGESQAPTILEDMIFEIFRTSFLVPSDVESMEREYILRDEKALVPRAKPYLGVNAYLDRACSLQPRLEPFHQDGRHFKLTFQPTDDNGSKVQLVDDPTTVADSPPWKITVRPEAWACKPGSILSASSQLRGSPQFLTAFSGTIESVPPELTDEYRPGDRVCGWIDTKFSSRLRLASSNIQHLPESTSHAEGASLVIPFMTAIHALVHVGQIMGGQTILIHTADGESYSALQIAASQGLEVFATFQSSAERNFLQEELSIPEDHLIWDEEVMLKLGIQRLTRSRGVDIILNSSSGAWLRNVTTCLKDSGKIIQIGELDEVSRTCLGKELLERNLSFSSVDIATLVRGQPDKAGLLLNEVIQMLRDGQLKHTAPNSVGSLADLDSILKSPQSADHSRQLCFDTSNQAKARVLPKRPELTKLSEEGVYVVLGNFDALSLSICQFLISRGAKGTVTFMWEDSLEKSPQVSEEASHRLGSTTTLLPPNSSGELLKRSVLGLLGSQRSVKGIVTVSQISERDVRSKSMKSRLGRFSSLMGLLATEVDFNIILSSTDESMGPNDHVTDAVGSSYLHIASRSNYRARTSLVSRNLTSGLATQEMFSILDYTISTNVDHFGGGSRRIIMGIDFEHPKVDQAFKSPLFCLLPRPNHHEKAEPDLSRPKKTTKTLSNAENIEEARLIVIAGLRTKIASLVALDHDMIDSQTAIQEFGLDSLVIFTFRNWIFQNFKANMEPNEISDASSIDALTSTILERTSTKFRKKPSNGAASEIKSQEAAVSRLNGRSTDGIKKIPKQPLPKLEDSLQHYLVAARPFCSDEEFERTSKIVEDFAAHGGTGRKLHRRLEQKAQDPNTRNWLSDTYLSKRFLQQRSSLVACQSYFGTHPSGQTPHTQAERAAIVSLAAMKFKHDLESGELPTPQIYGQSVDADAYRYLFNVCREPRLGEDIILEYPSENYIVVLRYGQAFKIKLDRDGRIVPLGALMATFEQILRDVPRTMSWTSILTADNREIWAKLRDDLAQKNKTNRDSLDAIQGAAFVVCLDDATPATPVERFYQFLFSDGSNRWFDKSLQFIVCSNGVSASLCEHSLLDGITVGPIHEYINQAIHNYSPSSSTERPVEGEALPLEPTDYIDNYMPELRQNFKVTTSHYSFAVLDLESLSSMFLQKHKIPVQSGLQLAIQLAYRRFFGYTPPALETVSLAHFQGGRVEVNHIIQPEVLKFIDAWVTAGPSNTLKPLFYEAARSHAKSLTRASKGRGFSRYLLAMEWMLEKGETTPLFSDPIYTRMKPKQALTSCFSTGWVEGGFVYPFPESILVYFEFNDQFTSFSIFGNDANADKFQQLLRNTAEELHGLLKTIK